MIVLKRMRLSVLAVLTTDASLRVYTVSARTFRLDAILKVRIPTRICTFFPT